MLFRSKSIRRGEEENALAAAYEMYVTSPDYLDMLWKRLVCISVEDVGFGEPYAVPLIRTLNEMRREFPYADRDQALFFVHGVRCLCRCRKERTSDHLRGMLSRAFSNGYVPRVPDWACDMYTARGREMGRGPAHFAQEAEQTADRLEDADLLKIHAEFLRSCKDGVEPPADGTFRTNAWQY